LLRRTIPGLKSSKKTVIFCQRWDGFLVDGRRAAIGAPADYKRKRAEKRECPDGNALLAAPAGCKIAMWLLPGIAATASSCAGLKEIEDHVKIMIAKKLAWIWKKVFI